MKNSHAFDAVCFQLHSDFVGASQQFADSPSASNFNHLNHAALAHQQAQWLKKTPQLTALRRDLTCQKNSRNRALLRVGSGGYRLCLRIDSLTDEP
jgi:hypothetical protein